MHYRHAMPVADTQELPAIYGRLVELLGDSRSCW